MRALALLVLLTSGCSLYYPTAHSEDDQPPPDGWIVPPDASVTDAGTPGDAFPGGGGTMARCEDGRLYAVAAPAPFEDPAPHGAGRVLGRCADGCRSAALECTTAGCGEARALCTAPVSPGATCPLDGGACRGTGSIDCPETTGCSTAVVGSTCTCTNGTYRCAQATPAAATQARLVGKWRGTVTTPGFVPPYPITLWIYPDGSYWPECNEPHCSAFYYGGDGPSPDRKLEILSTSASVGSWADLAIDFGFSPPNRGTISALVVDAQTLRFTFSASWYSCGQPFDVNLTRQ